MKRLFVAFVVLLVVAAFVRFAIAPSTSPSVARRTPRTSALDDASDRGDPSSALAEATVRSAVTSRDIGDLPREPNDAPTDVRVVVTDDENQPIPGAVIAILGGSPVETHATGADGSCAIVVAAGSGNVDFRIEAGGFVPVRTWHVPQSEIHFVLQRCVVQRGRVIDATSDAPIPGARLRSPAFVFPPELGSTTTDSAGAFELRDLAENEEALWVVSADGYVTQLAVVHRRGAPRDVVVRLRRGIPLVFEVVDALTGASLSDATIAFGYEQLLADGDGRIATTALLAEDGDSVAFVVNAPGHCTLIANVKEAEASRASPIRVPMVAGHTVVGTVKDEHGALLRGASVQLQLDVLREMRTRDERVQRLRDLASLPDGWEVQGCADWHALPTIDGAFEFAGLLPWSDAYSLVARAEDRDAVITELGPLGGPAATTTLDTIVPSRGETGTVVGRVTVNGNPYPARLAWAGKTRHGIASARSDASFRLEAVECGAVTITPTVQGLNSFESRCAQLLSRPLEIEVAAGQTATCDVDIQFASNPIRGTVTQPDGSPASGLIVSAFSAKACWWPSSKTDAAGRFWLGVEADVAAFTISVNGGADGVRVEGVAPGRDDLRITLPGIAHARLRFLDATTREPLREVRVSLRSESRPPFLFDTASVNSTGPFQSDGEGWFSVAVPPGAYTLAASDSRGSATEYTPIVGARLTVSADPIGGSLEFLREKGVRVVLQLAPGREAWTNDEYVVALVEPSTWEDEFDATEPGRIPLSLPRSRLVQFDAKGRASIGGLTPGTVVFKVVPPTMSIAPSEIVVTGDGEAPVELSWRRN